MKLRTTILALCTTLALGASACAQQPPKLDAAARTRTLDSVLRHIREGYVFPDVAETMEKSVRERAAGGAYDRIDDGDAFAAELTRDLRAVSHDKHIRVHYSAEALPSEPALPADRVPAPDENLRRDLIRDNCGVTKLEVLPGNVGFIAFRYLAPPEAAGDTYTGAMAYVGNTDALILDLRQCGGAISMDAIPLLCSYFFPTPTHLNDIYWRPDNSTRQFWTSVTAPGKRYLDRPIYILTSRGTFSGAEELAYDLKNLKRATIVGETTGGGANPGGDVRVDDHFQVFVPVGRAINPITKTNWEGVGVSPDVSVPAAAAQHTAHAAALRSILAKTEDGRWKEQLRQALAGVERSTPRVKKVTFTLKGHADAHEVSVAGSFNGWNPRLDTMVRTGDTWTATVEAEPGRQSYKFVVDGRWIVDPANPATENEGEYQNSVRTVE